MNDGEVYSVGWDSLDECGERTYSGDVLISNIKTLQEARSKAKALRASGEYENEIIVICETDRSGVHNDIETL